MTSYTTEEDTPVTIDVVANDTDAEDSLDPATVVIRVAPSNGTALVDTETGAVTYTPVANFHGTDVFLYEVFDVHGASDWAAVTVEVLPVNDPPHAVDDEATVVSGMPVTIDVLANDSDVDQNLDPTTVTVLEEPAGGSIAIDPASGEITYTPLVGFHGLDSFTYQVFDAGGLSDAAAVIVEVFPANGPPEPRDDEAYNRPRSFRDDRCDGQRRRSGCESRPHDGTDRGWSLTRFGGSRPIGWVSHLYARCRFRSG